MGMTEMQNKAKIDIPEKGKDGERIFLYDQPGKDALPGVYCCR
jgi:hypothetical protein